MADEMTSQERLKEALELAALAGAEEIRKFLGESEADSNKLQRVKVAVAAVGGYTRWRASHNNAIAMMLVAARQSAVSPQDTLELARSAGVLPPSSLE